MQLSRLGISMRINSERFIAIFEHCFNSCCYRTWWKEQGEFFKILHDFKLPPRRRKELRSSGLLRSEQWLFFHSIPDSLSVPSSWVKYPRPLLRPRQETEHRDDRSWVYKLPKIWEPPQNPTRQKGDTRWCMEN